jgi:hypothetical protein
MRDDPSHGVVSNGEVDQLEGLLQSLPLASNEFGVAINRLSIDRRYLQSTETGAACWELNILANQIRTQAKWNQSKAIVLNRLLFRGYQGFALFQQAHERLRTIVRMKPS